MIEGLRELQARFHFDLALVDVDDSEDLRARYGDDVPVLVHGERELCRHVLNPALVTDYLVKIG